VVNNNYEIALEKWSIVTATMIINLFTSKSYCEFLINKVSLDCHLIAKPSKLAYNKKNIGETIVPQ
jgi:hypothetical protein